MYGQIAILSEIAKKDYFYLRKITTFENEATIYISVTAIVGHASQRDSKEKTTFDNKGQQRTTRTTRTTKDNKDNMDNKGQLRTTWTTRTTKDNYGQQGQQGQLRTTKDNKDNKNN